MKKHSIKNNAQHLTERIASCIWAFALLCPLVVLAGKTGDSRLSFHITLFICGWFCWSFTEYYFHRFVMHEGNQKKGIGKLLNHTHHHTDPEDIRVKGNHRMLMAFACILFASISIYTDNYFTVAFGYIGGFSAYSMMHYILHQTWSVKVFPGLHRFHIHHHCKHPDKCFGVITTFWDRLFNTVPRTETEITERIKQFYYKQDTRHQQLIVQNKKTNQ